MMSPLLSNHSLSFVFFFFNTTPTTEIYTLSLHDALPIYVDRRRVPAHLLERQPPRRARVLDGLQRSEEHTSELQSHHDLVCRLLLEKKKKNKKKQADNTLYNRTHLK